MIRFAIAVALLLGVAPAIARAQVEAVLPHVGRLLGSDDRPVTGTKSITFSLYRQAAGGDVTWSDTLEVALDATGAYVVQLGEHKTLPHTTFDEDDLFLGLTIDGQTLEPRLRVGAVPLARFAAHAVTADNLDCVGCVTSEALAGTIPPGKLDPIPPSSIDGEIPDLKIAAVSASKITGTLRVEALPSIPGSKLAPGSVGAEQIADNAVSGRKLSGVGCATGQVLKWSESAGSFACMDDQGQSYVGGGGVTVSGNSISISAAGVDGTKLAPGSVGTAHLAPGCGPGQLLKSTGSGWTCANDELGTASDGGLTQVSVNAPLAGRGTAASPLVVTAGGIGTTQLGDGAVTEAKLSAAMGLVQARGALANEAFCEVTIGGQVNRLNQAAGLGFCMWVANAQTGAVVSAAFHDTAAKLSTAIQGATNGQLVVIVSRNGSFRELVPGNESTLRGWGLHRLAAQPPPPARPPGAPVPFFPPASYAAAFVKGSTIRAIEASGPYAVAGVPNATVTGRLVSGELVGTGQPEVALGRGDTSGAALFVTPDGGLAIPGNETLEFGHGIGGKEANAGKIGYGTFSGTALDIVGAGPLEPLDRKVKIWAEGGAEIRGPVSFTNDDTTGRGDIRVQPDDRGTELVISNGNVADDGIRIRAGGGTFVHCPVGWNSFSRGKLCMEAGNLRAATDIDVAIRTCSAAGARVCTAADFQVACQYDASGIPGGYNANLSAGSGGASLVGYNPFLNASAGWYGDSTGDDYHLTWNANRCISNNDGPPAIRATSLPYRCCF